MRTLLATVGSSPLPVVVAVRHLQPERLMLLYTDPVHRVADRIAEHLRRKLPRCTLSLFEIRHHRTASGIREHLQEAPPDWPQGPNDWAETGLAYTGGTKPMAVHVHAYWRELGGRPEHGCYLAPDGRLYFDDGRDVPESDLPALCFEDQCRLHLGEGPISIANAHHDPGNKALAIAVRAQVAAQGWRHYRDALKPCRNGDTAGTARILGVDPGCIDGQSNATKFLEGDWLEVWLAAELAEVREHGDPLFDEVLQSVRAERSKDFELDVVAIRGFRVFVFSCTAKSSDKEIKLKFFEALHRAARIGGEHARAALVCLHEHPPEVLQTVQAEAWPAYDTMRLFGSDQVAGRAGVCYLTSSTRGREPGPAMSFEAAIKDWVLRP